MKHHAISCRNVEGPAAGPGRCANRRGRHLASPRALRWIVSAVAVLLLPPGLHGQQDELRFTRISTAEGLSHSVVTAIVQDRRGFGWVGTQDGLNRYDGYHFEVYKSVLDDSTSLSDNLIAALYEDRVGDLWIGTLVGLNRFDRDTETFVRYRHDPADPNTLSSDEVIAIHEDRSGELWIGTAGGLNRLDRDRGRFTRYTHDPADPATLSHDVVWAIHEDRSGELWIGTAGGLNRLDRDRGKFTRYTHDPADPATLSHEDVRAIHEDRAGTLWIGTMGGGLNALDRTRESFVHHRHDPADPRSLGSDQVRSIYDDRTGALWVGTNGGLHRFDQAGGRFLHFRNEQGNRYSLSDDQVRSVFEDRTGLLWVGTSGGLHTYDRTRERFAHYRHDPTDPSSLSHNTVWSIYEDRAGRLWVGSDFGLNKFDRARGRAVRYLHDPGDPNSLGFNVVLSLQEDRTGRLWVGTDEGLDRLDPEGESFVHYRHDPTDDRSLSDNSVLSLYEDRTQTLWVGTDGGGLNRFDPSSDGFVRYRHDPNDPASLSDDEVHSIFEDRAGTLWVGTWGGLNRLDRATGRFIRYLPDEQDPASVSHRVITSFHEDESGVLWIASYGGGLNRFDPGSETFTHYREPQGLSSDAIYGILGDDEGRLWLSTNQGLSRFDPDSASFARYDVDDGLQSDQFTWGSFFKSSRGELFFGGVNGFNAFFPEEIESDPSPPTVVITDFKLFNASVPLRRDDPDSPLEKPIQETESITLSHEKSVFSFEFAGLHFANPDGNRYAYRLEGFDRDWINTDASRRFAVYTNLDPGPYVFRVRASSPDGVWSDQDASVAITILPPPWATWWAYGFYLFAVGGTISGYVGAQRKKLARQTAINLQLTQAEEATRRSEALYRSLVEGVEDAIFTLSPDRTFTSLNPAFESITGWPRDDWIGKHFTSLLHPEDHTAAEVAFEGLMEGKTARTVELRLQTALPEGVVAEITVTSQILDGEVVGLLGIARDVTDRKQLEAHLLQSQKLETVGRLAGGIAHDFNNLLTPILGYAETAMDLLGGTDPVQTDQVQEDLQQIRSAGERAAALTRQLLLFSRPDVGQLRSVDLNGIVQGVDKMLTRLLEVHIELVTKLSPSLWPVRVDRAQIEQVLTNLAVNARDAMPEGGTLTFETANLPAGRAAVGLDAPLDRDHVVVSVRDTGLGMDESVRKNIFEPFFTTKAPGEGTGLGLAICYGVVKQAGGQITVETEPGRGTCFRILLPRSHKEEAEAAFAEAARLTGGSETILLAEDNVELRSFAATVLRRQGYRVLEAGDGSEAIQVADVTQDPIHLLLTDIVMPTVGGKELADRLRERRPELKVVFASGYFDDTVVPGGKLDPEDEFIQKPFTASVLARVVRRVLDSREG